MLYTRHEVFAVDHLCFFFARIDALRYTLRTAILYTMRLTAILGKLFYSQRVQPQSYMYIHVQWGLPLGDSWGEIRTNLVTQNFSQWPTRCEIVYVVCILFMHRICVYTGRIRGHRAMLTFRHIPDWLSAMSAHHIYTIISI